MSGVEEFDPQHPDLGWQPAAPLPYFVRSWRSLFRWRPACYECSITFRAMLDWKSHWFHEHRETS